MRVILCIMSLILFLSSCTSQKILEVPVETVKTEYIHDVMIDSVFVKDSVNRWISGDTVYIYKEKYKYKYINKTDSICKTDTITKVVTVDIIKEVEVNHIKWYQKALMWIGGVISLLAAGFIVYKVKFK